MSRPLSAGRIPVGRQCPGARVLEPDSCAFVFIRGFRLAPCNPASLPIDRSLIILIARKPLMLKTSLHLIDF
jgi:hypothetical protein